MPTLKSGRQFRLALPDFANADFSLGEWLLLAMLAKANDNSQKALRGLIPILTPADPANADGTLILSPWVVKDVIEGVAGWTDDEVAEFSALLLDWPALDKQLAASQLLFPSIAARVEQRNRQARDFSTKFGDFSDYLGGKHGYAFALFDVLGFEKKIGSPGRPGTVGVQAVEALYRELAKLIADQNRRVKPWHEFMRAANGSPSGIPIGTGDGDFFIPSDVFGMYVSDSFAYWTDRNYPLSAYTISMRMEDGEEHPGFEWNKHPIPPDTFLELCNEAICRSIELGLPLRGAVSSGPAAIRPREGIFLGEPIVEAARMESAQDFIGVSLGRSFVERGLIAPRFKVPYSDQIKRAETGDKHPDAWRFSEWVLDWPLHWRTTRTSSLEEAITVLDNDPNYKGSIYRNTLQFVAFSSEYASTQPSSRLSKSITEHYPYFNGHSFVPTILIEDQ